MVTGWVATLFWGVNQAKALSVGDNVPDLAVSSTSGESVNLRDINDRWKIVYFYPKSFTPGCTRQACGLRDSKAELDALNAVVFGVSTDNLKSQNDFKSKHELPFDLLADVDKKLTQAFGALGFMGMAKRMTFIINPEGFVTDIIDSVSVGSHESDVIKLLKIRQEQGG